jgi:hypothetical protein
MAKVYNTTNYPVELKAADQDTCLVQPGVHSIQDKFVEGRTLPQGVRWVNRPVKAEPPKEVEPEKPAQPVDQEPTTLTGEGEPGSNNTTQSSRVTSNVAQAPRKNNQQKR